MKKTKNLTFCAMCTALGVVMLLLCSFLEFLSLTAVLLASVCIFVVREELHSARAFAVYLGIGIIAVLIVPSKLIAIEFFIYAIYPVLKGLIEKCNIALTYMFKGIYIVGATIFDMVIIKLFFSTGTEKTIIMVGTVLVSLAWLILYDVFYTRLSRYYNAKLRSQLRIDRFFG